MRDRKIGERFNVCCIEYQVRDTPVGVCACTLCDLYRAGVCNKWGELFGPCAAVYRGDHRQIYFKEI